MEPKWKTGFIRILKGEGADKEGKGIQILYFPPEYSYEKSNSFSEISTKISTKRLDIYKMTGYDGHHFNKPNTFYIKTKFKSKRR